MKKEKNYKDVPTIYYKPEIEKCLECGRELKRSHRVWDKYIIQLSGIIYAISMGYRCSNAVCSSEVVYRSCEAESLSLKYYSFGLDVITTIGNMRFVGNKTIGEIHTELSQVLSISGREIQYLIEIYMLLVTGIKQDKDYLDKVISPEGIILSIDGIQPEKGNEILYVLRDVLSGEVLGSENLKSSDEESIKGLIEPVIELGYPILGVVSDGQDTIRKAVASLLPDKPYQLCHYHYLDNVGKELEDKDRKLKTKLKKNLRVIRTVEKQVEEMKPGVQKEVLEDFTVAVRTTVQENSVYPFDCGGIKVYAQMKDIESAISSCQQEQDHPLLEPLKEMVSGYKEYEEAYKEVTMLSTVVKDIGRLIDPDNYPGDNEAKRKQRLNGYMGYVASLKGEHIQLSDSLEKIIKVTKSFMPGLFAYYQCPGLPVTNNDLERFHRKVKTTHRRRTGRKSSHDYMIRLSPCLILS